MAAPQRQSMERIGYYDSQLLSARDLQDDAAYQARMRGLHVRYIHNTWGIALGYEVHISLGGDTIAVGPGIAYDGYGREVVSARTLAINLPGTPPGGPLAAAWWDLTIRYLDLPALLSGRDMRDTCGDSRPNEERPEWHWHFAGAADDLKAPVPPLAGDIRLGVDIPIARFRIRIGGQVDAPDLSVRRYAQGLLRPHLFSAQLAAGSGSIQGSPLNWSLAVDASAGGFSQVPYYFATLADHPLGATSGFASLFADKAYYSELMAQVLGPFVSIQSPGRSRFTLEVHMALPTEAARSQWQSKQAPFGGGPIPVPVQWLGIEPTSGCPPAVSFALLRTLSGLLLDNPLLRFVTQPHV